MTTPTTSVDEAVRGSQLFNLLLAIDDGFKLCF